MDESTTKAIEKVNLLGLTREKMAQFFISIGEKPFRSEQMLRWMHHKYTDSFVKMHNISQKLQQKLTEVAHIKAPEVVESHFSKDGTCKWIVRVASGSCVETVYIPERGRGTLCVSSQAGCALDCSFCSTGKQGFNSDLTVAEIIGQVWIAACYFNNKPASVQRAVTNVVMMGMGEPLLNFDHVVDAMALMMDDLGYGLSKRRVTLSTSGVVPALKKLSAVSDVSLAISLHAANDELRNQLVPINKKYPIASLLTAATDYINNLPDKSRSLTVEYILLAGVNDSLEHAKELTLLLKNIPCKINLIPFNPFPYSQYERPSNNQIRRFQQYLKEHHFNATVRKTRGDDIDAACGQLVGNIADKTPRSARYISMRQLDLNS